MKKFLLDLIEYIIDLLLANDKKEIIKDDEPIIDQIETPQE